jgi:hypothetical protein
VGAGASLLDQCAPSRTHLRLEPRRRSQSAQWRDVHLTELQLESEEIASNGTPAGGCATGRDAPCDLEMPERDAEGCDDTRRSA